jgi:NAD(P)H-dependent flavin oxidoreductase YrpB (nitropropane dioxygenase family)
MWPDRRLTDLLGIKHPIIQAPMAGSATPELPADQLIERMVSESAAVFARLAGGDPGD